jgi:hypothetical protein
MAYVKPSLCTLGPVGSVVLGSSVSDSPDNGIDSMLTLDKPEDVVAGLDE